MWSSVVVAVVVVAVVVVEVEVEVEGEGEGEGEGEVEVVVVVVIVVVVVVVVVVVFRTCSNMFWGDLTYSYSTKTFWLKWDFLFSVAFSFLWLSWLHSTLRYISIYHVGVFIRFAFHMLFNDLMFMSTFIFFLTRRGLVGAHASHPNLASPWRKPSHWPGNFGKLGAAIHHTFSVAINNFGFPLSGRFFESVFAGIWPNLCRLLHRDSSISYRGYSKHCISTWTFLSYWGLWLMHPWEIQDQKFIFRMIQRSLGHSTMKDHDKPSQR